jgi:ribosome-associated protein
LAAESAYKKKAEHITILNLKNIAAFTNYFLICEGNSEPQIKAIIEAIEEALRSKNVVPHHVEGRNELQWVLMDYDDFIIHIFLPKTRSYYELEKIWGDTDKLVYQKRSRTLPKTQAQATN